MGRYGTGEVEAHHGALTSCFIKTFFININEGIDLRQNRPDKFLVDNNDAISGTLYFYQAGDDTSHNRDQYKGGYATRVIGLGTSYGSGSTPSKYISVAQSFFVTRNSSETGTIKFTNAQRIENTANN